jgi:tetratricopeptide (TPR) repeat protein
MGQDQRDSDQADQPGGRPHGEVYDWYRRGLRLLDGGDAAAAAQVLSHAADAEPASRSIREALARAHFDAGHYIQARDGFRSLVEASPDDDYAHFGYGLSSWRLGDLQTARQHLALATTMRPDATHYAAALGQVVATLRAREDTPGIVATPPEQGTGTGGSDSAGPDGEGP